MNYQTITIELDPRGVVTLTLRRPAQHNALSGEMIGELTDAVRELAYDPSVRVVVLSGEGESFCAGADLNWMKQQIEGSREQRIVEARRLALMLKALRDLPKPLIARVNGQAYGGGVGLVSVCDSAIAAETARLGLTEARLGLIPATISPYVIDRIGAPNAMRLFTSARIFGAAEALEFGLVNLIVPSDGLDNAVEAEIRPYLQAAPGAIAAAKALVRAVAPGIGQSTIEMTLQRLADTWETAEASEGVAAFLEKRKPNWAQ
ncbi:crotonase/enoyl-CoA hydratase family protein [Sinorhizobium sp. BG8]|uniref:crotonase/enoyl-CoA hydratase family protein n=1 Tax=Sinorhizobium sp. BG8 TaxID=2613773 RepID=UPI00193CBB3E|nr:crotonase/enoyl-CoA hydratase family protein [Sinorhizobium sp. BG8]QRM53828.1 crotonase/enoyl-CoA hydratase family protein [Sinorhizobium sp. BG8]